MAALLDALGPRRAGWKGRRVEWSGAGWRAGPSVTWPARDR